jgi:tetratricopeptide (TPR) repeat protein
MLPRRNRFVTAGVLLAGVSLLASAAANAQEAPSGAPAGMGTWLVDVGRDYALSLRHAPADADADYIIAFMRAAARVDPSLAEPHLWLFDLYQRTGQEDKARLALREYVRRDRQDLVARLQLVALEYEARQSAEDRQGFCEALLGAPDLPVEVASDLHRRLGNLLATRGDTDGARKHFQIAVDLVPGNVLARRAMLELAGEQATEGQRVEAALAALAANPWDVDSLWELSVYLDSLSMESSAWDFYARAIAAWPSVAREAPPLQLWLDYAQSLADGGQSQEALTIAKRAVLADTTSLPARWLVVELARRLGDGELAEQQNMEIESVYDQIGTQVVQLKDYDQAAQIVWYYTVVWPDPQRAEPYVALLSTSPGRTPDIRRALGYAYLAAGKYDEALIELRIMADECPWAGLGIGRALLAKGETEQAIEALRKAATLRCSGPAYQQIIALLDEQATTRPTPPDHPRVRELLEQFDRRKFDFFESPQKYLQLTAQPARQAYAVGQPMAITIRLANIGPFNVTLGDGLMVSPIVRVIVTLPSEKTYGPSGEFMLSLNRTLVLSPGQYVEVPTRLDVGPVRAQLATAPLQDSTVLVDMLLAPVQVRSDAGISWTHEPGGFAVAGCQIRRLALDVSTAHVESLLRVAGVPGPDQIAAAEELAAFYGERARRAATGWPMADPDRLEPRMTDVLADTLRTSAWPVRCHLLEAMRWHPLAGKLAQAAADQLQAADWPVRMMAVRLFAMQHGKKFLPVLEHLSANDGDALVRDLADAVRRTFSMPATAPADEQTQGD